MAISKHSSIYYYLVLIHGLAATMILGGGGGHKSYTIRRTGSLDSGLLEFCSISNYSTFLHRRAAM